MNFAEKTHASSSTWAACQGKGGETEKKIDCIFDLTFLAVGKGIILA